MKRTVVLLALLLSGLLAMELNARTYGLTGFRPVWKGAAPRDGIGVSFRFRVADNASESLKLIFSDSRLCGMGPDTYLIEYNVYDGGLRYEDWVYTTWPMQGTHAYQEASLRVAVPDYIRKSQTGAQTFASTMFPRQTYEIDGIDGLWKTDLITQVDMNGTDCKVVMTRGNVVTDLSGWRADGAELLDDTYRQWDVMVEFNEETYHMAFALPERHAQHLCSDETLIFFTEFLHGAGLFRVFYWDFAIKREQTGEWEPIHTWRVAHHDGSLDVFGVCKTWHMGHPVIEVSNDRDRSYLATGTLIDITPFVNPVRGDVDGDGETDRKDLDLIVAARNTRALGPADPRDLDGDGSITVLDARILVTLFTVPAGFTRVGFSPEGVVLEWNENARPLKLQSSADPKTGPWQDVRNLQSSTNAVIGTSAERMFFRLVLPE